MVRVEIVEGPLARPGEMGAGDHACGAVVEFQGVVRGEENGAAIAALGYECHVEMARVQLTRIAEEVAAFFGLSSLVVLHRIGVIPVGETSLYVRAASKHRRAGIMAVDELIVRLKRDVPIWKHAVGSMDRPAG